MIHFGSDGKRFAKRVVQIATQIGFIVYLSALSIGKAHLLSFCLDSKLITVKELKNYNTEARKA